MFSLAGHFQLYVNFTVLNRTFYFFVTNLPIVFLRFIIGFFQYLYGTETQDVRLTSTLTFIYLTLSFMCRMSENKYNYDVFSTVYILDILNSDIILLFRVCNKNEL